MSVRAVFDCMVFVQAAANPRGAAFATYPKLKITDPVSFLRS